MAKKVVDGLGERLRELRGEASRASFAARCGVSDQSLADWEAASEVKGKTPSAAAIVGICTATGVSADWLLGLPHAGGGDAISAFGNGVAAKNSTVHSDLSAEVSRLLGVVESQMRVIEALSRAKGDGK